MISAVRDLPSLLQPDAVLFDWDDTLVDTWPIVHEALNIVLMDYGMSPWTLSEVKERGHQSARDSAPLLFGDRWEEALDLFYRKVKEIHLRDGLKLMAGAADLIAQLSSTPLPLGIVSNKRGDLLRKEVNYLGWSQHFKAIVGSGDAEKDKPHPEPIFFALSSMNMEPSSTVWMIGDSPSDWFAGKAAGCKVIAMGENIQDHPSDCISVANCHDLKKILMLF
jgi:phosphoglycolate phosphatase